MNVFRTALLMTILTLLLIAIGGLIGGHNGVIVAFVFAAVLNFGSYWFSDKIVLAMYRAQPAGPGEAPEIYNIVSRLTQRANLPMPRIYIIPTEVPNAFATGRNPSHAVVAVTSGLMRSLSLQEIEGVLAHELAHVKNRDILIGTIAATLAGTVTMLARMASWAAMFGGGSRDDEDRGGGLGFLILAIVAPIAAILIQLAISRSREYAADHDGSEISGTPLALADALRKLEMAARNHPLALNPSTAHMFIVNPLKRNFIASLFSTHPPIQKRIERLENMAGRR
jgi:heat shock protein HtpX